MNKRAISILAILALVPSSVHGQNAHPVTWQPGAVVQSVGAGGSRTLQVTFQTTQALNNVILAVTPELSGSVTVSPTSISSVTAGATVSVQLVIRGTAPAGQSLNGTIRIRRGARGATLARPLPVTVITASDGLPPDPGAAGQQTLEGIDSDGDGLRDDLQRYLFLQEPDSSKRGVLILLAKRFQNAILEASQADASLNTANRLQRSIECLHLLAPAEAKRSKDELLARVLNTAARTSARRWRPALTQSG